MGYIIINGRGQQVGKGSSAPILTLEKGERISYVSDLFSDLNDRGCSDKNGSRLVKQINRKGCRATIKTERSVICETYWHTFQVIGTNPSVVNETVEELLHMFGQVDVDWKDISRKIDSQENKKEGEQNSSEIVKRPSFIKRLENWLIK